MLHEYNKVKKGHGWNFEKNRNRVLRQDVCQVKEKSENSPYPVKSQRKVREFSEKSGRSQGILVKLRHLFKEQQIEEKVSKFRYISKISDFERINTRKKV